MLPISLRSCDCVRCWTSLPFEVPTPRTPARSPEPAGAGQEEGMVLASSPTGLSVGKERVACKLCLSAQEGKNLPAGLSMQSIELCDTGRRIEMLCG